jgi:hypothetical protein
MNSLRDESLIRAAFAEARALEPTEGEIAAVLRRAAGHRSPRGRRLVAIAFAALAVLVGSAYAIPATRAGMDGVVGTFSDWARGSSSSAPGRPLGADEDAAAYLRDPRYSRDPRVIAEADGYKLIVAREPGGGIQFDLGDTGVGVGGWKVTDFAGHAVVVLGPGAMQDADEDGHVPLFGITARSVKSVELVYASGPPLRARGIDGGFVLLAEPRRDGREVVAYDAEGEELERASLHSSGGIDIHWEDYGPPAPRVPSRCLPGAAGANPPPRCPNR